MSASFAVADSRQTRKKRAATSRIWAVLVMLALLIGAIAAPAEAGVARIKPPAAPSLVIDVQAFDPQRHCQTIRTCRFERGGSYRGCLSSFSCRSCRFVPAKCSIGGASGKCQRQVCDWGA
jgi:hypothetical protein